MRWYDGLGEEKVTNDHLRAYHKTGDIDVVVTNL